MPNYLTEGKQHSSVEANQSRLVTKTRWVVESINGLIKRWLYFNNIVENVNIPNLEEDFKIICAIINKYRPPRVKDQLGDRELAIEMLKRVKLNNELKNKVQKFQRKSKKNQTVDFESLNFPILTEDYIRKLAFGIYQLKQAQSYTREHLNSEGLYEFEFVPEEKNLVKVKLNSRHLSSTIYTIFIEFDKNDSKEPIKSWCCDCKSGLRTVGCCAHVASVMWYLGVVKNKTNLIKPIFSTYLPTFCKNARQYINFFTLCIFFFNLILFLIKFTKKFIQKSKHNYKK